MLTARVTGAGRFGFGLGTGKARSRKTAILTADFPPSSIRFVAVLFDELPNKPECFDQIIKLCI